MTILDDLFAALRFFSRLPVPPPRRTVDGAPNSLSAAAAMVPTAGAIIAISPCLTLMAGLAIGLPAALAASLAIATLVIVTGALHEDGLSDCADGFGGGSSRERKLEIMRDSRIGTFGACAVALSLYLRTAALGIITAQSPMLACAALVAAASISRTACLMPLLLLPPARDDGLGAVAGRPLPRDSAIAIGLAFLFALAAMPFGASVGTVLTALAAATIGALIVCAIAWRQIYGQTGDVAGTAQQIAEIVVLLTFSAG